MVERIKLPVVCMRDWLYAQESKSCETASPVMIPQDLLD